MLLLGKKGMVFAAFLVIIAIICMTAAYYQITKKFEHIGFIGDSQSPQLFLNQDVQLYELFIKDAAIMAMKKSIEELKSECNLLNEHNPQDVISILPILQVKINNQLNSVLEEYEKRTGFKIPKSNFELSADKESVSLIASSPTIIPLKDNIGKEIGTAYFRPSVKVEFDVTKIQDLYLFTETIAKRCGNRPDGVDCANEYLKENQDIEFDENTNSFKSSEACFGLVLQNEKEVSA